MLNNLMYVTVYVSDQDRALEFYTEKLGLRKRIDFAGGDGRFLTVAPGDASVEIILWPGVSPQAGAAARSAESDSQSGSRAVPGSIFLQSDDIEKDFELFRSRGVTFLQEEPTPYPFGVLLTALDPDGNRIELRQPRNA